jgi:hypothetical protein
MAEGVFAPDALEWAAARLAILAAIHRQLRLGVGEIQGHLDLEQLGSKAVRPSLGTAALPASGCRATIWRSEENRQELQEQIITKLKRPYIIFSRYSIFSTRIKREGGLRTDSESCWPANMCEPAFAGCRFRFKETRHLEGCSLGQAVSISRPLSAHGKTYDKLGEET